MNIIDMEENMGKEEREEKLRRARKSKRRKSVVGGIFGMLGGIVALAAGVYGGMMLYEKLPHLGNGDLPVNASDGREPGEDETTGENSGDAVDVMSDSVIYSQEDLDRRIAEAVAEAQDEEALRVLNGIKEALSAGTTTVETLRPYYPNDIVVVRNNQFYFVPINRELKQSQLDVANLRILENGEYQYLTDGQVTSHKGIDVSSHQGQIDWNLVAQDGVEFAIIRVGYRGYGTEGKLMEDQQFDANIQGAKAAGIKVGVYFFSQAISDEEAVAEANLVLEKIAPYQLDCPVVYDVEMTREDGRMNNISVEERTRYTLTFCQTIENAGYKPMIYHNTQMGALLINIAELEAYDKWYAAYSDQMFYPYEYKIWQYSDQGRIQGIGTNVDLNICFEPIWNQ